MMEPVDVSPGDKILVKTEAGMRDEGIKLTGISTNRVISLLIVLTVTLNPRHLNL